MTPRRSDVDGVARPTIFSEMTALALRTGAVNLGQGFPDDDAPEVVRASAQQAIDSGYNQYPPGPGIVQLREAVAHHQQRFYGLQLSSDDVVITMGATEAIAAAVLAFVQPGDEVVMFEPYYDSYAAMVDIAGGVRRTVPLRFPELAVEEEAVRAAFSDRTRLLLLNTPHNPTGKVFTESELSFLADVARQHDVVVLSDEVYEHLTYDGRRHVPATSVSDLGARTLTISSAGKTFNVTGWKVGWVHGPSDLVTALTRVKQFLTFAGAAPLQPAVATALQQPDAFFANLNTGMRERRDKLLEGLTQAGFEVAVPEGGYFILADAAGLGAKSGREFAQELPKRAGVVAIPADAFCEDAEACGLSTVLRFAFCKSEDTIRAGVDRLINTFT